MCPHIFVTDTPVHIPSDSYCLWLIVKSLFVPNSRHLYAKPAVNCGTLKFTQLRLSGRDAARPPRASTEHKPQTDPAKNPQRAEAGPGRRGPGHLRPDTLDSCDPCRPSQPHAKGCPIALLLCCICEVVATPGKTYHIMQKFIISSSRVCVFLCVNLTLPKLSLKRQSFLKSSRQRHKGSQVPLMQTPAPPCPRRCRIKTCIRLGVHGIFP